MTKIKFCGLSRPQDIQAANELRPDYIGFVFAAQSSRRVSPRQAVGLKRLLAPEIPAVGVFVREAPETVAALLESGVIHMAQLHGGEDGAYLRRLRALTRGPVIQALRISSARDLEAAEHSAADYLLLDSGAGTGKVFDWGLIRALDRPYFLAGGLGPDNVGEAIARLHPFAVDVSSGIETAGKKDPEKMAAFAAAVRKEERP